MPKGVILTAMRRLSNKASLFAFVVLPVLSLTAARVIFWFIHDPEGPNLLIVTVLAVIIYLPVLAIYKYVSYDK